MPRSSTAVSPGREAEHGAIRQLRDAGHGRGRRRIKRWEYREVVAVQGRTQSGLEVKGTPLHGRYIDVMNHLGAQGWELVNVSSEGRGLLYATVFYFKRPLP